MTRDLRCLGKISLRSRAETIIFLLFNQENIQYKMAQNEHNNSKVTHKTSTKYHKHEIHVLL